MHEPLSLGCSYKQLNVIPADKEGLYIRMKCLLAVSAFPMVLILFSQIPSHHTFYYCYLCVHGFSATYCSIIL